VTAFRYDHEPSTPNGRRHLLSSVWRSQEIAVTDKDECRDGNGCKAWSRIDPRDDRFLLPRSGPVTGRTTLPPLRGSSLRY
jgi:hypothetical protein